MAKNQKNDYFKMLSEQVAYCGLAAKKLHTSLTEFHAESLPETMKDLHVIENDADHKKHEMIDKLIHEFITPIEREDIMDLAGEIDDITDAVEDILLKVYMYNVLEIRPEAIEFATIIEKCCETLQSMMDELHNFKKSQKIKEYVIQVNHLEEEGDSLYTSAIRDLYTSSMEPLEIIKWTEVFECFEKCCDSCEHVADIVQSIVMKNT